MDLIDYLKTHAQNLNKKDIKHMNIEKYEYFKKFIDDHYELEYMKKNNYIKYVKIIRQKIVYLYHDQYYYYIDEINQIIKIMSDYHVFYKINFNKYLYNIDKIKKELNKREKNLYDTIHNFQEMSKQYGSKPKIKFQILHTVNSYSYKLSIFKKLKREILCIIQDFIDYEESFGIDQKLIQLNNMERTYIGKKSEYCISKLIHNYTKKHNQEMIYKENIDIFKLLHVKINSMHFKGELDGLLLKIVDGQVIIEHIIEVKSSIKSSYEDIYKILALQEVLKNMTFSDEMYLDEYVLTSKSFEKIIHKPLKDWLIYMIIDVKNKIDKSHLYFAYVLKIIDNEFIKNYYVEKKEDALRKKHHQILKKEKYVQQLFNLWVGHVNLNNNNSILFMLNL
jgi:hypothetical protein